MEYISYSVRYFSYVCTKISQKVRAEAKLVWIMPNAGEYCV